MLQISEKFLLFFGKMTSWKHFKNSIPKLQKFSSRHWSTCCFQISWNLADGKSVKSGLVTWQNISPGSPAVATDQIVSKICQGQPLAMYSECSSFHSNWFIFGEVIAERVNSANMCYEVNLIFSWSIASSEIIMRIYASETSMWLARSLCSRRTEW